MSDYIGRQNLYRWADCGGLEVTGFVVVPLSEEVRRILTTLWEQYDAEANRAKGLERVAARYPTEASSRAAIRMWLAADDTVAMVSTICYDLFGVEGPDHLHAEDCAKGDCPIFEAGFELAQETVHEWLSDRYPPGRFS